METKINMKVKTFNVDEDFVFRIFLPKTEREEMQLYLGKVYFFTDSSGKERISAYMRRKKEMFKFASWFLKWKKDKDIYYKNYVLPLVLCKLVART